MAGCAAQGHTALVTSRADRDGLSVRAEASSTADSIVVEATVENHRPGPVHLVPTQCGQITEVILVRTVLEPEGETWSGSPGALKRLIIDQQSWQQHPDGFAPRRPGDTSGAIPGCDRPEGPVVIAPGGAIAERWELPLWYATSLDAVGSSGSAIRVEVVEARDPDRIELLDILPAGTADSERAGRNVRIEVPASNVIDRSPRTPASGPSLGQEFDRLLDDPTLRAWVTTQPPDGWRQARLDLEGAGMRLRAVTTAFERAVQVTALSDGTVTRVELPGEADRTRVFPRSAGTLPPGIALIDEPEAFVPTEDMIIDGLELPTGRVAVGEFLEDLEPLDIGIEPGVYPVRLALARYPGQDFDRVAFASLVVSDRPTARWELAHVIAVDGGTTTFTSAEGASMLAFDPTTEAADWQRLEHIWDSLTAHDNLGTEAGIEGSVNMVMTSAGVGDGGYQVFLGYDAADLPTRVVVDFALVHLDWPTTESLTPQ